MLGSLFLCSAKPTISSELVGTLPPLTGRVLAHQVHRQDDVLKQSQGGQQLEELKQDPQVATSPDGHLVLAHLDGPACR